MKYALFLLALLLPAAALADTPPLTIKQLNGGGQTGTM